MYGSLPENRMAARMQQLFSPGGEFYATDDTSTNCYLALPQLN